MFEHRVLKQAGCSGVSMRLHVCICSKNHVNVHVCTQVYVFDCKWGYVRCITFFFLARNVFIIQHEFLIYLWISDLIFWLYYSRDSLFLFIFVYFMQLFSDLFFLFWVLFPISFHRVGPCLRNLLLNVNDTINA